MLLLGFPSVFKTSEHGFTIVQLKLPFLQVAGYSCPEEDFGFLGGDLVNVFQFYFVSPLSFSFLLLFVTKNPGWHLWGCYLARMWYLFSTLSPTCQPSFPSSSLISTFVILSPLFTGMMCELISDCQFWTYIKVPGVSLAKFLLNALRYK